MIKVESREERILMCIWTYGCYEHYMMCKRE